MKQSTKLLLWEIICLMSIHQNFANWPEVCETRSVLIMKNKCYEYIIAYYADFITANNYCKSKGGHLAIIKDERTMSEITKHPRFSTIYGDFWIGITDNHTEGDFRGIDGSAITIPENLWGATEPDNYGRIAFLHPANCVVIWGTNKMYDELCEDIKKYICEYTGLPCNMKNIKISNSEYASCSEDQDMPYRTKIDIRCQNNYFLQGPSSVICGKSGQWSVLPQCIKGCPEPNEMPNAELLVKQTIYEVGFQVTYVCEDGYVSIRNPRKTHAASTCKDSGLWDPPIQGCTIETRYSVGNLELAEDTSVTLPCVVNVDHDVSEGEGQIEKENATFLWYKNSRVILFADNPEYNVYTNGTLTLSNISKETVGFYMCFRVGETTTPAKMGFNLKMKPEFCPDSNQETNPITTQEGTSLLLLCPHDSSYNSFTWFKNGNRFYVNGDQILFPDGSLYFNKVDFQDGGTYVCQTQKTDSFCATNRTTTLTVMALSESVCGKSNNIPDHHPWAASLWIKDETSPFCYGTLIHDSWVITTAQCLAGFNRKRNLNLFVRFHNGTNMETDLLDVPVKTIKIHPMFSKKLYVNDVALLQLNGSVLFSTTISPICLTETDFTKKTPCDQSPPITGTVIGWGPLEINYYHQSQLLTENMTLANDRNACFPTDLSHFDKVLCSEKSMDSRTTFAGDAGSSYEVSVNGRTYLFGVYSWGKRASLIGEHDYFTKMSDYVPWVKTFLHDPLLLSSI